MGFSRVPYELRPLPRRTRSSARDSDPLVFYARFLNRVVKEGKVPIGFETATRTFEIYCPPRQLEKYKGLTKNAREHAAYLKSRNHVSNERYIMGSYQRRLRQRLENALVRMEEYIRESSPHFY